jgi:hypothetical protein
MRINEAIFGKHAFRKSMQAGSSRSVINVALFDIFSTEFAAWPEEKTIANAAAIRNASRDMLEDETFLDAISRSTNSTRNVRIRFEFAANYIRPLLS